MPGPAMLHVARLPAGRVADVTLADVRGESRLSPPWAALAPVLRVVFGDEVLGSA